MPILDFVEPFPYARPKLNFSAYSVLEQPIGATMELDINPQFPVGNAAGWCKSLIQARHLLASAASFIVMGSITMEKRDGNPGNTFNGDDFFGLNALGLPNPGIRAFLDNQEDFEELFEWAKAEKKPIILSVAGFSPKEYQELAEIGCRLGFDGIELNLGCPNVIEGKQRKPIASFDLDVVGEILSGVRPLMLERFISVKLSPMTNPLAISDLAEVLKRFPNLGAVVTQNTFPNCLLLNEDGSPQIQTPDGTGWAGGSGSSVFAQALGQVNQWHRAMPDIPIWGVGGVSTGRQVRDILRAGGSAGQVGTAFFNSGARIFGDIASEYVNL